MSTMAEFEQEMDAMRARVVGADYSAALAEVHTAYVDGINRAFADQVGPDGSAWAPRRDANPAPLLNVTGRLRAAATGGEGHVKRITANSLVVGVAKGIGSLAGAFVHQFGAVIRPVRAKMLSWIGHGGQRRFAKQVTIPARPYVGMDSETRERCTEIIGQAFGEKILGR